MENDTSKFFENKSHEKQRDILVERIVNNIPEWTTEHACEVVEELYWAIKNINELQEEFENGNHHDRMRFLTQHLNVIAENYGINKDDLKGELLKALMISQCSKPEKYDDWKIKIPKGPVPKKKINAATNSLLEVMDFSIQKACCDGISDDIDDEINDGLLSDIDPDLASRAMQVPLWSESETALKWQLAVNTIIVMHKEEHKDEDVKARSIACALQIAVVSVTHLKYLFLMAIADKILQRKLSRYLSSALPSCIVTTIKKTLNKPNVWQYVSELSIISITVTSIVATNATVYEIPVLLLATCLQTFNERISKGLVNKIPHKIKKGIIKSINEEYIRSHEKHIKAVADAERKCNSIQEMIPDYSEIWGRISLKHPQSQSKAELIHEIKQSQERIKQREKQK